VAANKHKGAENVQPNGGNDFDLNAGSNMFFGENKPEAGAINLKMR